MWPPVPRAWGPPRSGSRAAPPVEGARPAKDTHLLVEVLPGRRDGGGGDRRVQSLGTRVVWGQVRPRILPP